jgi:predicted permease
VLLFALVLSLATGIIFGLAPALAASRTHLTEALKEGRRTEAQGKKTLFRGRNAFVISQFALSLVLANAGLLLVQSYSSLRGVDQGFDRDHTLTMALSLGGERYAQRELRPGFYDELIPRLATLPGVRSVGATSKLPLEGGTNGPVITEDQFPEAQGQDGTLMERSNVVGDYFQAMGIPLLAGRLLTPEDSDTEHPGVVINETAALRLWPEGDPLGKRFSYGDNPPRWETVVGVVGDVRQWGMEARPRPESYGGYALDPDARLYLTVRAERDPLGLVQLVREEVLRVDPNLPVSQIRTMGDLLASQMSGREFYTLLVGFFSVLALGLAAAGIYGVVSYFVARRTHELGIRLALGAGQSGLLTLVVRRAAAIVFTGLGMGIIGVLVTNPLIASLLFGVHPLDIPTLAGGLLLLLCVGIGAALLPGYRATRLSPVAALRSE